MTQKEAADILIVEDSRVQAMHLEAMLARHGHCVRTACNGQEALEMAQDKTPAVIISDIVMPVLSGYELCNRFKSDPALKGIPIILLTGLSDVEDIILGLEAAADFYLTKPFDEPYLLEIVSELLSGAPPQPSGETGGALDVTIVGKTYHVCADRRQMLNLLLSTYHNAVRQNQKLRETQMQLEEKSAELEKANEALQEIATRDGLTGLYNVRAFREKLEEEWQRWVRYGEELSVVMLDIDHFKSLNDTFGHPAGDEVLRTVARLLQDQSRRNDFVARYGGEEFVLLLSHTGVDGAIKGAQKWRTAIESQEWPLRPITASLGAATSGAHIPDAAALIERADQALYVSKRGGRNRSTHERDLTD